MSLKSSVSKLTLAFLLGLPSSYALAQDAPLNTLPPTVVSPTDFSTPSEQVGSSVTVITGDQIQRDQLRTVEQALQAVPGLNVVQTGGPGGQTSVFIRGTGANSVKVLIDGIDASDPSNPNRAFDFGSLTTGDIERIEVLRGPQSGLYGADAMGGVISITTKKGEGPPKWTAMVEGGSFGTFNQQLGVSGGTNNSNYAFSITHNRSSTPTTPLDLLPPGQQRINDFYDNTTYSGKVGVDLSDTFGLNFVGRYTDQRLNITEDDLGVPNNLQTNTTNHYFYGLADAVWHLLDGKLNSHVGVSYTDVNRFALDQFAVVNFGSGPNTYSGNRTKGYWKTDYTFAPGQTLLTGVERDVERANTDQFGLLTNASNGNTGAYAELHSSFGDRLFLTSNIRHDENDVFGGHNTWRLAPSYVIKETDTVLKGSYGTGYHAPSLDQIYGPFTLPNTNLQPEISEGYDFGFEQGLWQKRVRFGATYFHNDLQNLIICVGGFPCTNENVKSAKIHGIESFVAAQVTNTLQFRADYTRTIAIDESTGLQLQRRPIDKTSVSAVWQPTNKWTLSATALWVSGWMDVPREGGALFLVPGYNTVNLAANYQVNENLVTFARIDNLLDKHYQDPYGWEKTGFGIYAGLRVTR